LADQLQKLSPVTQVLLVQEDGKAPSAGMLQSALDDFEAKAQFDGSEQAGVCPRRRARGQAERFSVISSD